MQTQKKSDDFPCAAIIYCEFRGQNQPIEFCCMKNSMDIETTLEIRNGPDYKMYKSLDLSLALKKGQFDYDKSTGLKFILRERFEISTQNSPLNNSLNHYYYDTASNK